MNTSHKNQRNSNLELLRILAMIFIVVFHLARHGFDGVPFLLSNPNSTFLYFFGTLGKLGVDIFIIISAYFMVKQRFTIRKLLILGGEVYFYSILCLIIFTLFLTPLTPISAQDILKSILPISHGYWFIADYIVLMLLSPFLNIAIHKLSKSDFLKLLLLVLILWTVFPTFTGECFGICEMIFFFVLYLIGGFIRLHVDVDKINMKKLILFCIFSLIITTILFGGFDSINSLSQLSTFNKETSIIKQTYSIFIVSSAISLFLIFLKRKEFSNKYINYISGSVLGVYLIHSNVFVWPWLFRSFLHAQTRINSPNLFIFCIISVILIYIICTGIDIVRRITIEKLWIWIVDNKLNNLPKWCNHKFEIFEEKISYYLK